MKNHYGAAELHALYDATIYEFHDNPTLPFTAATWNTWSGYASKLLSTYPKNSLHNLSSLDPDTWEKEAHEIIKGGVYVGIKEGQPVPDAYVSKWKPIMEKQLVTGGYRLAALLKSLNVKPTPVVHLDLTDGNTSGLFLF